MNKVTGRGVIKWLQIWLEEPLNNINGKIDIRAIIGRMISKLSETDLSRKNMKE